MPYTPRERQIRDFWFFFHIPLSPLHRRGWGGWVGGKQGLWFSFCCLPCLHLGTLVLDSTRVGGRGPLAPAGGESRSSKQSFWEVGGKRNSLTFLLSMRWTERALEKKFETWHSVSPLPRLGLTSPICKTGVREVPAWFGERMRCMKAPVNCKLPIQRKSTLLLLKEASVSRYTGGCVHGAEEWRECVCAHVWEWREANEEACSWKISDWQKKTGLCKALRHKDWQDWVPHNTSLWERDVYVGVCGKGVEMLPWPPSSFTSLRQLA